MAQCPFCFGVVDTVALTCPNCRARISRLCPVCTTEVPSASTTCRNCNADLATGKISASPPPAYAPSAPAPAYSPPAYAPAYAAAAASAAPASAASHVPWEDASLGFGARFWNTCRGAMVAPGEFFAAVPKTGGLGPPTTFVFLLSLGASLVTIAFFLGPLFIIEETAAQTIEKMDDDHLVDRPGLRRLVTHVTIQAAVQPVASLAILFAFSGAVHLLAVAFGASGPFETTFRAIAYAHAPLLLAFVPLLNVFCTWYVALLWMFGLMGVAVGVMHGVGTGKGMAAVFVGAVPFLILHLVVVHHHHRLYNEMKRDKIQQQFIKPPAPPKPTPSDEHDEPPPKGKTPKEPDDGFVPRELRGQWLLDRPVAS